MTSTIFHILSLLSLLPLAASAQQAARELRPSPKPIPAQSLSPSGDVITDQVFAARRAAALEQALPPKPQPPKPSSFNLLEMSTAIQQGSDFILLPRGSVLCCPSELLPKVTKQPIGKFVPWQVFMSANRSWITTFPISAEQVAGTKPIAPEQLERFKKSGLIIVATLNGEPVTVLQKTP